MNVINDPRRRSRAAVACAGGGLVALIASTTAFGQCGGGGDCFAVHGPGCNSMDCCLAVCAMDAFCCADSWDSLCVNEATSLCVSNPVAGPYVNPANGNLYYILDPGTWWAVSSAAELLGGHLVSIFDAAESQWVVSLMAIQGYPPDYWIGLNDVNWEGSYVWEGGQEYFYTNWAPGQPDNAWEEDAVHVVNAAGQWNDLSTEEVRYAVAEIEIYSCGDPDTGWCNIAHDSPYCYDVPCCVAVCDFDPYCCMSTWDQECAEVAWNGCYIGTYAGPIVNPATGRRHTMGTQSLWTYTQNQLVDVGQSIVTIRSAKENEFLRRTFCESVPSAGGTTVWIGLSDLDEPGVWAWASGAPLVFSNWAPGAPSPPWVGGNFGVMQPSGLWFDVFGDAAIEPIVESDLIPTCGAGGPFDQIHGPGCDEESCCNLICEIDYSCCTIVWDADCVNLAAARCRPTIVVGPIVNPATRHTYYGVTGALWTESERLANEMGGHLAVPNNAAENAWLTANFLSGSSGFVSAMIGVHDQLKEGIYQAVDVIGPMPVTFTAWAPGEPNNQGNEDMVHLLPAGTWNDLTRYSIQPAILEIPCIGDVSGDGNVDASDLAVLLGGWGTAGAADLTFDGKVDASDLALLLGAWGACPTSDCCSAHSGPACDQPACTNCVCGMDSFCCAVSWDSYCVQEASNQCNGACQCGG
jgi:hypothetical protein